MSRVFSHFQAEGYLQVRQRDIQVLDKVGLSRLLDEAQVQVPRRSTGTSWAGSNLDRGRHIG